MYSPIYTKQQLILHTASLLELSIVQYKHRNQNLSPVLRNVNRTKIQKIYLINVHRGNAQ